MAHSASRCLVTCQDCSQCCLLGINICRDAANIVWQKPVQKWQDRTRRLGRAGSSVAVSVHAYLRQALTTLSYVAQLLAPPDHPVKEELFAHASLFRLPAGALNVASGLGLEKVGGPELQMAWTHCLACLYGSAMKTISV